MNSKGLLFFFYSLYLLNLKEREENKISRLQLSPLLLVPPPRTSSRMTDWLTSIVIRSLAADSDLRTCIACVRSWLNGVDVHGGRLPPGLCITDNLYKEVRSPPSSWKVPLHLPAITSKDLDLVKFTHWRDIRGPGMHDWCRLCNIRYHKV